MGPYVRWWGLISDIVKPDIDELPLLTIINSISQTASLSISPEYRTTSLYIVSWLVHLQAVIELISHWNGNDDPSSPGGDTNSMIAYVSSLATTKANGSRVLGILLITHYCHKFLTMMTRKMKCVRRIVWIEIYIV